MKKIFTLLFAVATVSIASAQTGNFKHESQQYSFATNSKQKDIDRINREYDYKISAVKMDRHLNGWQKSKQIHSLEDQRRGAIAAVQFHDDRRMAKNNGHRW